MQQGSLRVISRKHPEGWMTYGDGKKGIPGNNDNLIHMLDAVKLSKQDIIDAFNAGLIIYSEYGLLLNRHHTLLQAFSNDRLYLGHRVFHRAFLYGEIPLYILLDGFYLDNISLISFHNLSTIFMVV